MTKTSEGIVPYARTVWRGYPIEAPVCVVTAWDRNRHLVTKPVRTRSGAYVYALPCGGRMERQP